MSQELYNELLKEAESGGAVMAIHIGLNKELVLEDFLEGVGYSTTPSWDDWGALESDGGVSHYVLLSKDPIGLVENIFETELYLHLESLDEGAVGVISDPIQWGHDQVFIEKVIDEASDSEE